MAVAVRRSVGTGRLMLAVADRHRAAFARNFVVAMREVAGRITEPMIADAIAHPAHLSVILNLIDAAPIVKDETSDAINAYAEIFSQAGKATVSAWAAAGGDLESLANLVLRLDIKSPFMQRAAQEMSLKALRRVSAETKRAVRELIVDAQRSGVSPYETSLLIHDIIGLTPGQARAVRAYRRGLEGARDGTRSIRGLRGQWTLAPKVPLRATLDAEQVQRFTNAYADRLLEYRSYVIARTETLFSANMGQQLTWQEMARTGIIDAATFTRVWSVVDDDRLCEECAPMDGQAVALEEDFVSDEVGLLPSERKPRDIEVTTLTPPLHPSCRCVIIGETA